MCRIAIKMITGGMIAAVVCLISCRKELPADDILQHYSESRRYAPLTLLYPSDGTCFPLDIAPPTVQWQDDNPSVIAWYIAILSPQDEHALCFRSDTTVWTPEAEQWQAIKKRSLEKKAIVRILGIGASDPAPIISAGQTSFYTSKDEVEAPLFYREVNLPFVDAVKDPSHIRWRFGAVSSLEQPPVILENLPVCGNCHSFPTDGNILAMDVDYANSKGSYVITQVTKQMLLAPKDIITWNDYRREDGEQTFGLLSQISPDGNYIVSTVKDKSVFVPQPDLAFSQLFFPIKGILCVYNRQTQAYAALPGADDPAYVQSNPSWSPDGNFIVFARAKAYDLKNTKGKGKVLLTREECREFTEEGKPFLFDLYRIPFNGGQGGTAEPIAGASENGMSNYFAKYSPDGKWIVFCKAKSYMLLQPDSRLYIIPAQGGEARELECNTARMNSWHSWSPNGKWLVFASKANRVYTQLFLTHIDSLGRSTPPVLLSRFTSPDRAANIPEFVNVVADAIEKIGEDFLNDYSYFRAGEEFYKAGEADNAMIEFYKALELNPNNEMAHLRLGFLLFNVKNRQEEGIKHLQKVLQLNPQNAMAHYDLGMARLFQKQFVQAAEHLSRALILMPNGYDLQYNQIDMNLNLGIAYFYLKDYAKSSRHLSRVIALDPQESRAHYQLALLHAVQGDIFRAMQQYNMAIALNPSIDVSAPLHEMLAHHYAEQGAYNQAVAEAQKALRLARQKGDVRYAAALQDTIDSYKKKFE